MTQTALAARAGISPSYLNLIEHNRRSVGGRVLSALAEALGTGVGDLSEDGDAELLTDLVEAARSGGEGMIDPGTSEGFVGRYPEWARLTGELWRRIRRQEDVIAGLSDRLAHDPYLSENIHGMLSTITAISSAAEILSDPKSLSPEQDHRFRRSVREESARLSNVAAALASYLSTETGPRDGGATPEDALERFLARHNWRFEPIDREAEALVGLPAEAAARRIGALASDIAGAARDLGDPEANARATDWLTEYGVDAHALPLRAFAEAARAEAFDPLRLAERFGVRPMQVMRRLAVLRRPWIDAPAMGLVIVTASGTPVLRVPLDDFAIPRFGNACALWPLFDALIKPGEILVSTLRLDTGARFHALSLAEIVAPERLGAPVRRLGAMLVTAAADSPFPIDGTARPVGPSCRICRHEGCAARTDTAILAGPPPNKKG